MHKFDVWAPRAQKVSVRVEGVIHPMQKAAQKNRLGWWEATVEGAGPGSDYGFSLDDGDVLPDPRSPWQPYGVNGLSRLVNHAEFKWTDSDWQARPLSSAIIYELHIGTFSPEGTFAGAMQKLDHLVSLGVTHLELMPVNEFAGDWGWGYDGVDLYAPHHAYGTPDDLKRLVDACHEKKLAVLLDVVYNHLGPAGNYLNDFGPYFTDAYHTPWGSAVNLDDKGSYEARRFFADNALMWLQDYHFDGLRLDAVHAFEDHSAEHFLEQLASEVEALEAQLGRHFVLIAESDLNDPRVIKSRDAGGFGIDAQWSDDLHHALHSVLTGEQEGYYEDFGTLAQLATALQDAYVYKGDYSEHRQRRHGRRPAVEISGHRFLAYSQNHDQVGNRATGERLSHIVETGRQKIAAAIVLTSPFIPMLFQGEEFGASSPFQYFTNHNQELGASISEGRRKEFAAFGWKPEDVPDPQDKETFCRSKLNWNEVTEDYHADMLAWYKRLIELRKKTGALTDGHLDEVETNYSDEASWLVMKRGGVEVVCNLGERCQEVPVQTSSREVICSAEDWKLDEESIQLPADAVAILVK
jgi:maltooligosyltrehalose trehalohydrolase